MSLHNFYSKLNRSPMPSSGEVFKKTDGTHMVEYDADGVSITDALTVKGDTTVEGGVTVQDAEGGISALLEKMDALSATLQQYTPQGFAGSLADCSINSNGVRELMMEVPSDGKILGGGFIPTAGTVGGTFAVEVGTNAIFTLTISSNSAVGTVAEAGVVSPTYMNVAKGDEIYANRAKEAGNMAGVVNLKFMSVENS